MNRTKTISTVINDFAVLRRRSAHAMDEWWEGFSRSQRELVGILVRYPHGISVKELARILNVSSSAITQRVESLERVHLVERSVSAHDNRFVKVMLSKKALEAVRKTVPPFADRIDKDHFHALNDAELKQFGELIGKIAQTIEPVQSK